MKKVWESLTFRKVSSGTSFKFSFKIRKEYNSKDIENKTSLLYFNIYTNIR